MPERRSTLTKLIKRSFIEMMKDVATSIPGHVLSFDPATQLAQLQIGISRINTNGVSFTPPPLIECPVYVYGGSFAVEAQIDAGDEGIIIFSQRCIDAWNDTGGVADNPILRFHDFSDAYFLPGLRSQVNVLPDFQNNGIRLRNRDGDQHVWLKNDGNIVLKGADITIDASGNVVINGVNISNVSTTLEHNGQNIGDDHIHSGVQTGPSNTGEPV